MMKIKPYVVDLWIDGQRRAAFACTNVAGSALYLQGSWRLFQGIASEGCTLHAADLRQAAELMHQWDIPGSPPAPGTYYPKDGIRFLLALHATYCRGSRMWSTPSRSLNEPDDSEEASSENELADMLEESPTGQDGLPPFGNSEAVNPEEVRP